MDGCAALAGGLHALDQRAELAPNNGERASVTAPAPSSADIEEASRFFDALYPEGSDDQITIWTAQDKTTIKVRACESSRASELAVSLAADKDVFLGIGLRRHDLNGTGRGRKQDVTLLSAVWADVDVDEEAAARAVLESFPLPPSMLVWSGHGLHAYWLFDRPWRLDTAEDRNAADTLIKRFGATIAGDGVDRAVFELARVMRVPGTINHKRDPRPVRLLECHPDRRYRRGEIERHLTDPPQRREPKSARHMRTPAEAYGDRALAGIAEELSQQPEHGRNDALNKSAYRLARLHLAEAAPDAATCWSALWTACVENGLAADRVNGGEPACRATFDSGWRAGMAAGPANVPALSASTNPPVPTSRRKRKGLPHCIPGLYRLEDVGNGYRLVDLYGGQLRWCEVWGKWLVWDGTRWRPDDLAAAIGLAKLTAQGIYAEASAAAASDNEDLAKVLAQHARASSAAGRLRSMLFVAQPELATLPDCLDADPFLLNLLNGTLDLRTGDLRPHSPDNLITKLAPVTFDARAKCPLWLAFLDQVTGGDADRIRFLQRALGYCLTGDTREEVLFILYGPGNNGKSTLITVIQVLLGDYARQTPVETLLASRIPSGAGIPNDVAALKGARFVVSAESEAGRRLDEAKVKSLTGRDKIAARFMRAEWFEFFPEFKLCLATNHRPVIRGTDSAIWRRIRLIPFDVTIPPERVNKGLSGALKTELPGILNWALAGCLDWQRDGLGTSEAVDLATARYRDDMDILKRFISDQCIVASSAEAGASALYDAYRVWCEAVGERPVSQRVFGEQLGERGYLRHRRNTGVIYEGIGLRSSGQQR